MNNLRKNLKNISIIQRLSSIKITVVCLFLLFVLTLWGTVAQIDQGLYFAQKQFFQSWYFLVFNFLPFPGAQLVLWVLFTNLVCVSITRFVYKWSHLGIVIIHVGLLTYFVSAFVTLHAVQESNLTLLEKEGSNVSSSYHDWELSLWEMTSANKKKVLAFDTKYFSAGTVLPQINIKIKTYYSNAQAYLKSDDVKNKPVNASGIVALTAIAFNKEPEQNFPGVILEVPNNKGTVDTVLLYGKESRPTVIKIKNKEYYAQLRRKRYELPFVLTLKNFDAKFHPGTQIAKSFQSLVQIDHDGISREVLIYMNNPLRYKDYTLYQASYAVDAMGRELSTLAVVKNKGRLLPYISSLLTFVGLATHFLMMAFKSRKDKLS